MGASLSMGCNQGSLLEEVGPCSGQGGVWIISKTGTFGGFLFLVQFIEV